jgi:hypothetical protein
MHVCLHISTCMQFTYMHEFLHTYKYRHKHIHTGREFTIPFVYTVTASLESTKRFEQENKTTQKVENVSKRFKTFQNVPESMKRFELENVGKDEDSNVWKTFQNV